MPSGIHGAVDKGGRKDGACSAPCPAVENSGDSGQYYVAPVGKAQVGDMREAEQDRGGPPAGNLTLRRAREKVLQQAAEEKFFRPSGEKENAQGCKGKGLPFVPLRLELNEVHT